MQPRGHFRDILPRGGSIPKHGANRRGARTAEYRAWLHMRTRCRNPRTPDFVDYGARGIAVCGRWDAFENFLADMGRKPSPRHSIDRIDVNGNYEPGNVRWATPREQANNKRRNFRITAFGITATNAQWSRALGIKGHTLRARILAGWTPERAIGFQGMPFA